MVRERIAEALAARATTLEGVHLWDVVKQSGGWAIVMCGLERMGPHCSHPHKTCTCA